MAFTDLMNKITQLNKFFPVFAKNKTVHSEVQKEEINKNSIGASNEDYLSKNNVVDSIFIDFQVLFANKMDKIRTYREMSLYPEVSDATDNVVDDAIVEDETGKIVELFMKDKVPKGIEKKVHSEFNYLLDNVLRFHDKGWDLFRKWLIDGELYLEIILNKRGNNIIGVKPLPPFTMTPVYKGNVIEGFVQEVPNKNGTESERIPFAANQILYINYGIYGKNMLDVLGYYQSAVRVYNQLRNLEDSLVIYRLVRAPERRLFNIDVGRMPRTKAEEYIRGIIKRYKKKINYNSETGAIDATQNIQSLTEDFWFAKTSDGRGSEVSSLSSGVQLGELDDVIYFLRKLYKTLKLPKTRWDGESNTFNAGKMGEITREEVKFSRFIERLQRRFKKIFIDLLTLQLKLKKIDKKYIKEDLFDFRFTKSNLFKEYKEREIKEAQISLWSSISSYVATPDNPDDGVFSKEFAMKRFMGLSDEEYEENEKLKEKELKAREEEERAKEEAEAKAAEEETEEEEPTGDEDLGGEEETEEEPEAESTKSTKPQLNEKKNKYTKALRAQRKRAKAIKEKLNKINVDIININRDKK